MATTATFQDLGIWEIKRKQENKEKQINIWIFCVNILCKQMGKQMAKDYQ